MVCGEKLVYLEIGTEFQCLKCNGLELGYVYCPNHHYVCDECHGKEQFDEILRLALTVKGKNPIVNAEYMMKRVSIPMLGCEHGWIAAASLMAAIRNTGQITISDEQIKEALYRTKRQAIGAYCGLTGICGIAPAIGASFSVILGAACPKDRETAVTMHVVARVIEAVANEAGPCCCKNFLRTSLSLACELVAKHLEIKLSNDRKIICGDSHRHPHGCRASKCNYFNHVV